MPFSSPGDLPDPGFKPPFPALAGRFFTTEPPGKPKNAATARKIQTLWPILGKAKADNRLWSENETQTFMVKRTATE